MTKVKIVGGGFAGVEAAWSLADRGIEVELYEMKPVKFSPAHSNADLAELVCSNSFKATGLDRAAGALKAEAELLGSLCVKCAKLCAVPAGGALAVDRNAFSALTTREIVSRKEIKLIRGEIREIPEGFAVIAAGPLASPALSESIKELCGGNLSFFDAAAPIISAESVNFDRTFKQSRYGRGGPDDYINCPLDKKEYDAFYEALITAERAPVRDFDGRGNVYEGCMPIEVLASRGRDAVRYGPMKPVGLLDPATGRRPWANLQLRRENRAGTMYNLVGFQTNLRFSEQKRVFSMIPALENAEFERFGVMHRNTFIDSPRLLNPDFSFRTREDLYFAGQITGVEGYMESAASGIVAGINAARKILGEKPFVPSELTAIGSLARYVSGSGWSDADFQPMGANFGLLPPLEEKIKDKRSRNAALAERGLAALEKQIEEENIRASESP